MSQRIMRAKEVIELSGLSLSTLGRMEEIGRFPKRRKIGKNAVGWSEDEIIKWMESILFDGSSAEADHEQK
jgi:prophage regulatory protein